MLKRILIILPLTLFIIINLGCHTQSFSSSNNAQPTAGQEKSANDERKVERMNVEVNGNTSAKPLIGDESLFLIFGRIHTDEKGSVELSEEFWGYEDIESEAELYPNDQITLDIMNCAGYLASATTTFRMKGGMRKVKLLRNSVAADAIQKIKKCSLSPDEKIVGSKVFGVEQAAKSRANIKIGKISTKEIYNSLVKDIAEMKPKETRGSGRLEPPSKITKGDLLLEEDNWTDLDGDGRIDLIEFHNTPCENEKDTCTWIFRLVGGKWNGIDYIFAL